MGRQRGWPRTRLGYWKEYWVKGRGDGPKVGVEDGGEVGVWPLTQRMNAPKSKRDERRTMTQTKGNCKLCVRGQGRERTSVPGSLSLLARNHCLAFEVHDNFKRSSS